MNFLNKLFGRTNEQQPCTGELTEAESKFLFQVSRKAEYFPGPEWTDNDRKNWEQFIKSATGRKLDAMVFNFWVQLIGNVLMKPSMEELHKASGAWTGWVVAKSFAGMDVAQDNDANGDGGQDTGSSFSEL
jgi:hypothetical protein